MPSPEDTGDKTWGLLATAGFGLTAGLALLTVDKALAGLPSRDCSEAALTRFLAEKGGLFFVLSTFVTALVLIVLVLGFVWLRRSLPIRSYLALRPVSKAELFGFLGWALLAAAVVDGITFLSGRPIVPEVMVDLYRSAGLPLLYWPAMIALAPLGEELFFRGFLFKGILHSRLGAVGAILLTSLAWTFFHVQYEPFHLVTVLLFGLLLGYARLATGSILTPLAMHAFLNLIGTLEIALLK
jgi:uncharacterized protein